MLGAVSQMLGRTKGRALCKSEVVGHKIARVLQAPWQQNREVVQAQFYVLLDTGLVFELSGGNGLNAPLYSTRISLRRLVDIDFADLGAEPCVGDIVLDVLESDYWPGIGLLLSSQRFLHCGSDIPYTFHAGLSVVGDLYEMADCRPHRWF